MNSRINSLKAALRRHCKSLLAVAALIASVAAPVQAWAQSSHYGCFKITQVDSKPTSWYYTDPGLVVRAWRGAYEFYAGAGAYKITLNVGAPPFSPDGTLLGSAVSPIYNLGYEGIGGYEPEQVLYRCGPRTAGTFYEYYSTMPRCDGCSFKDVAKGTGVEATYSTSYTRLAVKSTNVTTGEAVTRYWKRRPLTNLDVDSQGWFLVKAKNFSSFELAFYQCPSTMCSDRLAPSSPPGPWTRTGASLRAAVSAFQGGMPGGPYTINGNLAAGSDSFSAFVNTENLVGQVTAVDGVILGSTATCSVTNATPVVNYPPMTAAEMARGATRQVPVTIQMQCQTTAPSGSGAFASGTAAGQTALGILAQPANAQSAIDAGLKATGTGVKYLLSDGFGTDPGIATGVGVALSRPDGTALNLLTNQNITSGGAPDGWDPVLNDATSGGTANGMTTYTRTINTTFKAFAPGVTPVKAGKFKATAQVIVRVQ